MKSASSMKKPAAATIPVASSPGHRVVASAAETFNYTGTCQSSSPQSLLFFFLQSFSSCSAALPHFISSPVMNLSFLNMIYASEKVTPYVQDTNQPHSGTYGS